MAYFLPLFSVGLLGLSSSLLVKKDEASREIDSADSSEALLSLSFPDYFFAALRLVD
tara:strand:+ start:2230 stop:2400 length:171 start_codon:yes stop_codon:yes gene_type:complete